MSGWERIKENPRTGFVHAGAGYVSWLCMVFGGQCNGYFGKYYPKRKGVVEKVFTLRLIFENQEIMLLLQKR